MKTFVLLALLGTVYAAPYPEIPCGMPVDRGVCDDNLPRWYFNRKTGTCEKFYYGGCGGNENRFEEKEMCEQTCVFPAIFSNEVPTTAAPVEEKTDLPTVTPYPEIPCGKPVDRGVCDGNLPRWYFNRKTGKCEKFYYGGCHGNENRFEEKEICEQTCVFPEFFSIVVTTAAPVEEKTDPQTVALYPEIPCGMSVDRGVCDDNLPRWYFNRKTGKCEQFYYGGCGGNENRFEEKEMCEQICVFPASVTTAAPVEAKTASEPVLADNHCERPPHRGPCLGNLPRYYYDSIEETCHPFVYGGCQSNGNNFESFSLCMHACHRR